MISATTVKTYHNYTIEQYTYSADVSATGKPLTMYEVYDNDTHEFINAYGGFNFYDVDTVMKAVEEIGLASDSIDGTAVNVGTLTDQLISLGYTNKDIYDLLNVLREVDGVTLLDANANVETLVQSLSDLGLAAQDGVEVTINADGLAALEASSSSSSSSTVIGGGLTGTTGTPNVIGNSGNYDTSGGQETENAHNIIKRMYANSQAWASSSPEKRTAMHEENKYLAAQLSRYGIVAVTDGSSWFVDRIGGQLLYDKYRKYTYHNGGIVGDDPTLKQDEVFAKLKKGEAVFTEEQQKPIYQVLDFAETMLGKYGKMLSSISDTDLMGVRMQEQIKQDTQQAQMVVENGGMSNEFNLTFPMQVLQKLDDTEIKSLTKKISSYTIKELDGVFALRGMRSFRR